MMDKGDVSGLEKIFWTYSSCGASGLNFSLVLTPAELVLKSGILKETNLIYSYKKISNIKIENYHIICRNNNTKLCYP